VARGEAEKTLVVKAAEAEAEKSKLLGEGVANQRIAIARGLKEAIDIQKKAGVSAEEGMRLVVFTQWLDAVKEVGVSGKATVLMMPNNPSSVDDTFVQITKALAAGSEIAVAKPTT
jgi:regulator of protease activity HflC (stomatin/prohibitin superfamily)